MGWWTTRKTARREEGGERRDQEVGEMKKNTNLDFVGAMKQSKIDEANTDVQKVSNVCGSHGRRLGSVGWESAYMFKKSFRDKVY